MPTVTGVLETSLYVDDLDRSTNFFVSLFGFPVMLADERIRALRVQVGQVLLLFKRGASLSADQFPAHDGSGPLHMAFSIPASEFAAWEQDLKSRGIAIEEVKQWERGGKSLYFRDPDGHLLELVTPGCWPNF
ncbi:MAG TPA: VOC family protein [Candidatus Acidoferrales bacterium]|nr:VOC family protein [Candidatus Acidoferrales bacterium]